MGSDLACPCSSRNFIETEVNTETPDVISQVMSGKLNQSEIILEFLDDRTKVCLIKTVNIEQFFNNRNLLRMNGKKEMMKYYNTVFITNYLARSEYCIIVLQDSPFKYKLSKQPMNSLNNSFNFSGNNNNYNLQSMDSSGKYTVDNVNLVSSFPEQVVEQLIHNFNSKLKKNYQFIGIINDFPKNNRQFYILSRLGYSREDISGYSIQVFKNEERDLNEEDINDIICSSENSGKRLKAIMIDFVQFISEKEYNDHKTKQKNSKLKGFSNTKPNKCKQCYH